MSSHVSPTAAALEWKNLSYSLEIRSCLRGVDKTLQILDNLSGRVEEGSFLAILGPSGSGKTSLMNTLAGRVRATRNQHNKLNGLVTFRGTPITPQIARQISYITQEDFVFSFLTVYETLLLSAKFHLPITTSSEEIEEKVLFIANELGLSDVLQSLIGNANQRGISGGEKKRVAIGKELMSEPQYLFLDEPTTGLDSFQAYSLVELLKSLTHNGRVVISVLHQPRSSIFELFDNLLLLSLGKTMYFGDAALVLEYFNRIGYQCPEHHNPGDFLLDIISVDSRSETAKLDTTTKVSFIASKWISSAPTGGLFTSSADRMTTLRLESPVTNFTPEATTIWEKYVHWNVCFKLLLWRAAVETSRNSLALSIRCLTTLLIVALLSLVFQNLPYTEASIRDRQGLLFFVSINQAFGPLIAITNVFPYEKRLVTQERLSSAYPVSAYFLGRFVSELPVLILLVGTFCIILYWSTNLNPMAAQFFIFLALVILETVCTMSLGLVVSAIAPSSAIANAIAPPVLLVFIIFGGFYINNNSLPTGSEWVVYISPIYWTFKALCINEFKGETFTCSLNPTSSSSCKIDGQDVLESLGFANVEITTCVMATCLLTAGFLIIAYIALLLNMDRHLELKVEGPKANGVSISRKPSSVVEDVEAGESKRAEEGVIYPFH